MFLNFEKKFEKNSKKKYINFFFKLIFDRNYKRNMI